MASLKLTSWKKKETSPAGNTFYSFSLLPFPESLHPRFNITIKQLRNDIPLVSSKRISGVNYNANRKSCPIIERNHQSFPLHNNEENMRGRLLNRLSG